MLPIYLDDSSMMTALEKALRSEGFEVMTPVEAGTAGAEDEVHLRWATEHGFILLTFDKHTMVPLANEWVASGKEHNGVIVCEQMPREAVSVIVRRLKKLAQVYRPEALKNVTVYLGAVWD
jgi:predicted nuclease of predicted toxin-antitoxin system